MAEDDVSGNLAAAMQQEAAAKAHFTALKADMLVAIGQSADGLTEAQLFERLGGKHPTVERGDYARLIAEMHQKDDRRSLAASPPLARVTVDDTGVLSLTHLGKQHAAKTYLAQTTGEEQGSALVKLEGGKLHFNMDGKWAAQTMVSLLKAPREVLEPELAEALDKITEAAKARGTWAASVDGSRSTGTLDFFSK